MESKFAEPEGIGRKGAESKFADESESKTVDAKPRRAHGNNESKFVDDDGDNQGPATNEDETQLTTMASIFGDDMIIAHLVEFWGETLSEDINTFFADYCKEFDDDSENKLVYTKIHKKYEKVMEKHLQTFREQQNITESEFYSRIRKATDKSELAQMIVELVLSCADFECFVDIMKSKRRHMDMDSERFDEIDDAQDVRDLESKYWTDC